MLMQENMKMEVGKIFLRLFIPGFWVHGEGKWEFGNDKRFKGICENRFFL